MCIQSVTAVAYNPADRPTLNANWRNLTRWLVEFNHYLAPHIKVPLSLSFWLSIWFCRGNDLSERSLLGELQTQILSSLVSSPHPLSNSCTIELQVFLDLSSPFSFRYSASTTGSSGTSSGHPQHSEPPQVKVIWSYFVKRKCLAEI